MPFPRPSGPQLPLAFSIESARANGLSRGWLNHPSLTVPYYGVRSLVSEAAEQDTAEGRAAFRARQALPRLRPEEAVSHHSALLIYGCPIRAPDDLHVTAQPTHTRNRTAGIIGHRYAKQTSTRLRRGVPLTEPSMALFQSATFLPLRELIVAADYLTHPRGYRGKFPAFIDSEQLKCDAASFRGRGARRLRAAVSFADSKAESRMETLTRLLLVAFGLSNHFEAQVDIEDGSGRIGRFDFVNLARKIIVEYDGEQHRNDRPQYVRDLQRLERARQAGFRVIRLLREDIVDHPHQTAATIANALGVDIQPHTLLHALLAR